MGIASLFMPTITGILADRWINAEKLYGILHILYALVLFYLPQVETPENFIYVMLLAMCFYMPTIALSNSISYTALKNSSDGDVVKDFPPIRVWGTVGFIAAMWLTNLSGNKATAYQFYIAGIAAILLGLYAFSLPKCKPQHTKAEKSSLVETFGLEAFKLFGTYKMALFFLFSMFLGGALQLTNAYGDLYLSEFEKAPQYADLLRKFDMIFIPELFEIEGFFDRLEYIINYPDLISTLVIKYSTIIMSISQVSETLFILAIPFFLKRFGIKQVMLISMLAWVLRFGLFAYGNPTDGLWMIIMSCIVYGMAFDFFNISGSLFVETSTNAKIRSSAQGLFMMMTNGFGAVLGSFTSGWAIEKYFTHNGERDWHNIWLAFAAYSLIIAIAFAILFKHKHNPNDVANVSH
jgi:NHS family xanthosine MFS transporter